MHRFFVMGWVLRFFVGEAVVFAEGVFLLGGGVIEGVSSCAHFIASYNK